DGGLRVAARRARPPARAAAAGLARERALLALHDRNRARGIRARQRPAEVAMTSMPAFPRADRLTGIISPMIVWALYFAVVYSLTGIGCEQGWHRERVLLLGNRLTATMAVGTALALLLI